MASGKVHNKVTVAITPIVMIGVFALAKRPEYAILSGIGCLSGIMLTPDLDQENLNTIEWALVKKTLGLGFLWIMYWFPYALVLKHRSFWSHFPIIGTAIRFVYQFWMIPILIDIHFVYYLYFFVGLCFSDIAHWYLDQ